MKNLNNRDPLEKCMRALDYIIDNKVGIVGRIDQVFREPGAPPFHFVYAQAANTNEFGLFPNFRNTGGASVVFEKAVAKAVGEAVERYSSAFYDYKSLKLSTFDSLNKKAIDPSEFALYSPEQVEDPEFDFVKFDKETPVRWTETLKLLDNEVVMAPAAMIFMPFYFVDGDEEKPYCQPISTGLACHMGIWRAVRSGICEVVERDAFTITWQAAISPPQIILESLSDENYRIMEMFDCLGSELRIFNITMDNGIPCVLSVLRSDKNNLPAVCVAAAADPDPEMAVRSSLEELAHTRRYCQLISKYGPLEDPGENFKLITSQATHLGYWSIPGRGKLIDFLFNSEERIEFDDLPDISTGSAKRDSYLMAEMIKKTGHDLYLRDLTTPDVSPFGFRVIKAIVPGYHPLQMGYNKRALGGRRLWEVPQRLGYPGVNRETGDHPYPHPYP